MRRICLIVLCLCGSIHSFAQGAVETVLREIERNNPELQAAAAALDEEKLTNRSEALLADPEVEFNYLWGAAGIGNRHDLRVTQSFDLPTLTGQRAGKTADLNQLSVLKYRAQRLELLQEARKCCIDLIYYAQLLQELDDHLERSATLVRAYERRLEAGGANILDLNKTKLHYASVQGKRNLAASERESLLARLRALNGGKDPDVALTAYDLDDTLPADFETWFAEASDKNPVLGYVRQEVSLGARQLTIDKMAWMPELTVGYMSEIQTEEKFRGVTVGVSIPLWSGANKVKRSRAGVAAAESRQKAAEQAFYEQLRDSYRQAGANRANAELLRESLTDSDYRDYLLSALTRGEISMVDYLVENDLYYEALEQTLDAEREYHYSLAALKVF